MSPIDRIDAPPKAIDSPSISPSIPFSPSDLARPMKPGTSIDNGNGSLPKLDIPPELATKDLNKIELTTPGQDAKSHTQPDYYLTAEGKLVKNPEAHPSPDGKIKIEVEGNNSAKLAEQYANKMQKETIQYLVELFKHAYPGEKIPEMWQSILNSTPDTSYPNNGDSQNNTTVTADQLQAYDTGGPSAPPSTLPDRSPTDASGAPSGGPQGASSGTSDMGGSPSGKFGPSDTQSNIPNQVHGNGGASTNGLQQSSGSIQNYDGDPSHMSSVQRTIVDEANKSLGQAMWGGWSAATADLGCAASVSQVLNNAGAADLHNAQDCNVDGVQADLLAQGWTLTDKPQPGDVWIGRGGASEAHTGIIGENNTLLDNHSNNGLFSQDSANYTSEWTNNVFLRPPEPPQPENQPPNNSDNSAPSQNVPGESNPLPNSSDHTGPGDSSPINSERVSQDESINFEHNSLADSISTGASHMGSNDSISFGPIHTSSGESISFGSNHSGSGESISFGSNHSGSGDSTSFGSNHSGSGDSLPLFSNRTGSSNSSSEMVTTGSSSR